MKSDNEQLKHSVAFRVTEPEWIRLKSIAENNGVSVPQLAKDLLFKSAGLHSSKRKKSPYGQASPSVLRARTRR